MRNFFNIQDIIQAQIFSGGCFILKHINKFLTALLILTLVIFSNALYADERPILIQGAMPSETDYMISKLTDAKEINIMQYKYVSGKFADYPVIISLTGSGSVNIVVSTLKAIEEFNPVIIINQGTAGAHDPKLHTFDIVLGSDFMNTSRWQSLQKSAGEGADYRDIIYKGASYFNYVGDDERSEEIFLQSDENLLNIAHEVISTYKQGKISDGVIATSDSWERRIDRIKYLHSTYGTSCEDMETEPSSQVASMFKIPFLGVRVISNSSLHNEEFNPASGEACQKYVLEIVKQYISKSKIVK